jgi:hypothetical protein
VWNLECTIVCFGLYVVEVMNLQTFFVVNQLVTLLTGALIGAPVRSGYMQKLHPCGNHLAIP